MRQQKLKRSPVLMVATFRKVPAGASWRGQSLALRTQSCSPSGDGLAARPCVDAVVAEKLSAVERREGQGGWSILQDGQVRQGGVCLAVAGSRVAAADCDDAAATGGDKFFR